MTTNELTQLLKQARQAAGYPNPHAAAKDLNVGTEVWRKWEHGRNLEQIAAFLTVLERLEIKARPIKLLRRLRDNSNNCSTAPLTTPTQ